MPGFRVERNVIFFKNDISTPLVKLLKQAFGKKVLPENRRRCYFSGESIFIYEN
jgi:hypothetical protein